MLHRKQPNGARAAGKEACKHDEPPHHRAQNVEARTRELKSLQAAGRLSIGPLRLHANLPRSVAEKPRRCLSGDAPGY
jgi:hypothetical protein